MGAQVKFIISKSRGALAGTRRKWADGVYVKGTDHKWHKEKLHEFSVQALQKRKNQHKDKELLHDFQEAAEEYIDWLAEQDISPSHSDSNEKMMQYWADHYEDKNWHTDEGYWKWSQAIHEVAKKYHSHLYTTGTKEEKESKKSDKKEKQQSNTIKARGSFKFTNPIHYARASDLISHRGSTSTFVALLDGKEITNEDNARILKGHTIEINGERGVVTNFYVSKKRIDPFARRSKRVITGIPMIVILTDEGEVKVDNKGPIKLIADPTGPEKHDALVTGGSLNTAGIKEIVFDTDIASYQIESWKKNIQKAFGIFSSKLGINFHNHVKIRVYGSKGPKRGALADYSSVDKVIRLSVAKSGSSEALAHELGHALDDKLSGWHGTGGHAINEVVRTFRETPQGKEEAQRLHSERSGFGYRAKASRYTSWMNKPEEIFARCFETYVAHKVPEWESMGYAKKPINETSYKIIEPIFDKLMKQSDVKKALRFILRSE